MPAVLEQYVYFQELSRRHIYQTFNPQGVGIIAASLIHFGTPQQQQQWAIPVLRATAGPRATHRDESDHRCRRLGLSRELTQQRARAL